MTEFATYLGKQLCITTTLVCIATILAYLFFKTINSSPKTRTLAWAIVLLNGWLLFAISVQIEVPWISEQAPLLGQPIVVAENNLAFQVTNEPLQTQASLTGPATSNSVFHWLTYAWIVGLLLVSVRVCIRYARLIRVELKLPDADIDSQLLLRQIQAEVLGESNKAKIRVAFSGEAGPFVCQTLRGHVIVVPRRLWAGLYHSHRRAVLKHELTHITRNDLWKITASQILLAPQWFNPLAWLAQNRFVESIEMACDQAAKGITHEQHIDYSKALLALASVQANSRRSLLVAEAQGHSLKHRIENVLTSKGNEMKLTRMFVAAFLVAIVLTSVFRVQLVARQTEPTEIDKQETNKELTTGLAQATRTYEVSDLIAGSFYVGTKMGDRTFLDRGITENDFEPLMGLIQETIDPDSWKNNGGDGVMHPYPANLRLIVIQTEENHKRIDSLLDRLRELGTISIAMDAQLLVMSPADLADSGVQLGKESTTIVSGRQARTLAAFAATRETSNRLALPPANFFNGEMISYPVPKDSDKKTYGGVDFSNIRITGIKMSSQDIVMLHGYGKPNGQVKNAANEMQTSYEPGWATKIPEGGFVAIDISDDLVDKESYKTALLLLHVEIHSWK